MTTTRVDAALFYASLGWRVFPCAPGAKVPLAGSRGVLDATTDADQIRAWWAAIPEANIGIATGAASGIAVLDIDPRNGGEPSWQRLLETYGECESIAGGPQQLTAGGGLHILIRHDERLASCKLADGVDLLSDGRYFIAWPSEVGGRRYEWEGSSDPTEGVAPGSLPEEWLSGIAGRRRESPIGTDGAIIRGNRNDGLTALAGAMRRHGMTEAEILAALNVANETRCDLPLPASEVSQIARSVARYAPDDDPAASAALGGQVVDALIGDSLAPPSGYYLTPAVDYLAQPAPIRWLVKGWIPERSVVMLYGESGAGKTFVALDIAASLATGAAWMGCATRQGAVVYLAGEGNYGLRQRVASWAKERGQRELGRLFVSNRGIDIDHKEAAAEILRAVREASVGDVSLLVIDTLNRHMAGDENKAQDVRGLLGSCAVVAAALGCAVMIVHHTGHGEATRDRERGSSALRAAMDASMQVRRAKSGEVTVQAVKAKDWEPPPAVHAALVAVDLGWTDEDGQPISGAALRPCAAPVKPAGETKVGREAKKFANAWWASGAAVTGDGMPFLGREALLTYLVEHDGISRASAQQYVKPNGRRLISVLLEAEMIAAHVERDMDGWAVTDPALRSMLILQRSENGAENGQT